MVKWKNLDKVFIISQGETPFVAPGVICIDDGLPVKKKKKGYEYPVYGYYVHGNRFMEQDIFSQTAEGFAKAHERVAEILEESKKPHEKAIRKLSRDVKAALKKAKEIREKAKEIREKAEGDNDGSDQD